MGITASDINLLDIVIRHRPIKSVCELGSQNLYLHGEAKPPFASSWYESRGIEYSCIDLAGDNNAMQFDLSIPIPLDKKYDLVTDFGTSEHVVQMKGFETVPFHDGHINSIYPTEVSDADAGLYNCFLNKHNLLNINGIMINVNPKTGNWPGHGYHYFTTEFYKQLVASSDYDIIGLGENASMGNNVDGWNVFCVLRKIGNRFPSFEEFKTFDIKTK